MQHFRRLAAVPFVVGALIALGAASALAGPALARGLAFYTWQAPGALPAAGEKQIALTFDDGPGPYTPQVLAVLQRYDVPATFFEIGEEVALYPQYTRELVAAGYPVEDHTWSHPDLDDLSAVQVASQISMAQAEIRSVTGRSPTCLRPPYDAWDPTVLDEVQSAGLTTMSYSVDSRDWQLPGAQAIVDNVVGAAFPGAVVDMHDGGGPRYETVEALPLIIDELRSEGYTFVSICGAYGPGVSLPKGPHALISSVRAVPPVVASTGGRVVVVGEVSHATTCRLELLSKQSFAVVYSNDPTTACQSGHYTAHIGIGPNPSPVSRTVAFELVARNSSSSFRGVFYIVLAAPPHHGTTRRAAVKLNAHVVDTTQGEHRALS